MLSIKKALKTAVLSLLIVAVGLLLAGCGGGDLAEDVAEDIPVAVATAAVIEGEIQDIVELTGTVTAQQTVNVVPKASGRVERVAVKVGQVVNRGDVILELEAEDLSLQLQQAAAGLAVAEANLALMKAGARQGELAQAKNALVQAEAGYENALRNLTRMETLHEAGAISLQQLESAQIQFVQAETGYNSAGEALAMLEEGVSQENLAVVEAQVRQAAVAVEQVRSQVKNAIITAPISGVIATVNVEAGEMAGAGAPVATVINTDTVEVEINVAEANINQISVGAEVNVLVSAVSNEHLIGKIATVSPAINPQTRQYPVQISLDNKDGLLKPGMFAKAYLVTAMETDAFKVPKEAIVAVNGNQYVFVVEEDLAVMKEVTLGLANNSIVQVTSGLVSTDEVVIKGQHRLTDGQSVVVENGVSN